MTSFGLFRSLKKIKKSTFYMYFYTFFLLKYIMGEELHHFMNKIQIFVPNIGIINWYQNKIMQEKL